MCSIMYKQPEHTCLFFFLFFVSSPQRCEELKSLRVSLPSPPIILVATVGSLIVVVSVATSVVVVTVAAPVVRIVMAVPAVAVLRIAAGGRLLRVARIPASAVHVRRVPIVGVIVLPRAPPARVTTRR